MRRYKVMKETEDGKEVLGIFKSPGKARELLFNIADEEREKGTVCWGLPAWENFICNGVKYFIARSIQD